MCAQEYKARCTDCGEPCSYRAERCRSCQEKFRWRDPNDPRRVPPYGLQPGDPLWPTCACGCGEPVPARKANCKARGYVKGEPCKYVAGHSNRPRQRQVVDGRLRCPQCEQDLPAEEFNADSTRTLGLAAWCRTCESKYRSSRRTEPPKYRRWSSPEARARAYASAYRARKRNQFVEHVDPEVIWERDKGICGICGDPIEGRFDVDHIVPLARGGEHSYANTQAAHPTCNYRKRDRLVGKETDEQEVHV